mmetsp:Transcript_21122/g.55015  ORF Transcript_21122/g.55015 Transcript_21122/m.55015 type:complete len:159 (+) Transcript_21122:1162-1638(+)
MDSLNDACHWDEVERLCGKGPEHQSLKAGSSKEGPALERTSSGNCQAITFSHFLPFQDLLPEKRFLTFPNLAKAVGSRPLGERISRLQPLLHVFGSVMLPKGAPGEVRWSNIYGASATCFSKPADATEESLSRRSRSQGNLSCAKSCTRNFPGLVRLL